MANVELDIGYLDLAAAAVVVVMIAAIPSLNWNIARSIVRGWGAAN